MTAPGRVCTASCGSIPPRARTPPVTPALIGNSPPPARIGTLAIVNEDGFGFTGEIRFEPSLNLLEWNLQVSEDSPLRTQALGLVFGDSLAPVSVNLVGPELLDRPRAMASSSIFLTPQLRAALENEPVFIRAFGGRFSAEGAVWPIEIRLSP